MEAQTTRSSKNQYGNNEEVISFSSMCPSSIKNSQQALTKIIPFFYDTQTYQLIHQTSSLYYPKKHHSVKKQFQNQEVPQCSGRATSLKEISETKTNLPTHLMSSVVQNETSFTVSDNNISMVQEVSRNSGNNSEDEIFKTKCKSESKNVASYSENSISAEKSLKNALCDKSNKVALLNLNPNSKNTCISKKCQKKVNFCIDIEKSKVLPCEKNDFPLPSTSKEPIQHWDSWKCNVQCPFPRKPITEERKLRQAQIQNLVSVLRHRKKILNDSGASREEENLLNLKNLNTCKIIKSQGKKYNKQYSSQRQEKINEHCQSGTCQIGVKSSEEAFNHESVHKCPGLKQTSSLCHRFEAQMKIIAEQKKQLQLQNKVISGLKLENLNKDLKLSVARATDNIKLYNSSGDCKDKSNETLIKQKADLKRSKTDNLFTEMKKREQWRKEMNERKAKIRQEQILEKEKELEAQRKAEEEERKKAEKFLKEKRRLRIENEKKKQLEKQIMEDLTKKAKAHYERKLMEYGMRVLMRNIKIRNESMALVGEYYNGKLIIRSFYKWLSYVEEKMEQEYTKATHFYQTLLLRRGLKAFIMAREDNIQKDQVADDFNNLRLVQSTFHKLELYTYRKKIMRENMLQHAHQFYHRKLLEKAFKSWTLLPKIMEGERKREERMEIWRQKVREIIPDFSPTPDE